jgi:outer membrane protein OmpA-like peptidoglycan-associated protein/outer membrane protein W
MNRNYIIYGLLLMFLSATSLVSGQTDSLQGKHSLEFSVIPSFNRLSYKSADNSSEGALGLGLQFGYTYHLTNRWGIGVGLRYQSFSATYDNTGYQATSGLFTETNGHNYVINQTLNNTEKQRVNYMMIPVMASYRLPVNGKLSVRVAAGAAYGLAIGEKLEFQSGNVVRSAYFPDDDLVVDNLPEQTLGSYTDYVNMPSGKQFKNAIMGLGEIGAEYALDHQWLLTASINGAIGSDVKKNNGSIIQQNEYSGVTSSNYVGAVKPVSVGLSIGVIYRFGRKARKPVVSEPVAPVVPVVPPVVETIQETKPVEVVKPAAEIDKPAAEVVKPVPVAEVVKPVPAVDTVKNTALDEFKVEVIKFNEDERIQFNFNERNLSKETKSRLDRLVHLMNESKAETIVVGHTCNIGSEEVNNRIGLDRALRVKKYLVEKGVPEDKIQIQSMGEKEPKYPNDSPENRAKNRRVEIIVK